MTSTKQNDFSQGKVWKNILLQAVPLTVAQLVQLLYNIVDRIYIGHLPGTGNLALTGIGLTFPIITAVTTEKIINITISLDYSGIITYI